MKVQLHLTINDAADALDQTARLVVGLADADDVVERFTRGDGEGGLVDDLVSGVKFWNDEVARRSVSQHPIRIRVVIGPNAGEAG